MSEEAQEPRKGGAPVREYVILELVEFDDDNGQFYVVAHRVEARNGTNALRKAFRELRERRQDNGEPLEAATLVPIPAGQWKPTPVTARRRESITVNVGA